MEATKNILSSQKQLTFLLRDHVRADNHASSVGHTHTHTHTQTHTHAHTQANTDTHTQTNTQSASKQIHQTKTKEYSQNPISSSIPQQTNNVYSHNLLITNHSGMKL